MDNYSHHTAPTQFVSGGGITFAYRRFGKINQVPVLFFQHFTGTLDNWDPAVTDGIAKDREVIIFDNAGIASTDGEVAYTIKGIAATALHFIDALGLKEIDIFGFSMGSFVAQQITLERPGLVRKLILVGSAPRGGEGLATFSPEVWAMFSKEYAQPDELLLETFFAPTETSQAAGWKFLNRIRARVEGRDVNINEKVIPAQLAAIAEWGAPAEGSYEYLKEIQIPVLVVNGKRDVLFPTINSYILQQYLPDAQLIIYPDSNHASQSQFTENFLTQVGLFLN
ncbi:alpha/beta fold hydrolase [Dyadobacter subterraneus]|uniref:Alpha/beta hydrolase n=1 Tax=Dyadobacter subterraneus TaxID=2773304 RepID=A0ABR9WDY3_9BACT|nr:alpha/beta hydrolase [Dyadobacter subterraneus]MBE9463344.1 alpha/beta hydrolase [Dyadobacter subterraneus]